MKLSRASTYALYGVTYIAGQTGDRHIPLSEIHGRRGVPEKHLAKIFQTLVKAGILVSARGVRGGFSLARPATEISPLDIIEAIEGRVTDDGCMLLTEVCDRSSACKINSVWRRAQHQMLDVLRGTTIAQLVSTNEEDMRPPVVKLSSRPQREPETAAAAAAE